MNKRLLLAVAASCLIGQSSHAMEMMSNETVKKMAWSGGTFLATALALNLIDYVAPSELAQATSNMTGYDVDDVAGVVGITGGLYSLGCWSSDESLLRYAVRTPLAAIVGGLSTTKFFSNTVKKLPVVGEYFNCKNHNCHGICGQCRLRGLVRAIGFYSLTNYALMAAQASWTSYRNK